MTKILTYIIGTVLINGIVIGAPYWRMLNNLEWWIRGRMEYGELFGFYEDLSKLQILIIGVLEFALMLILLGSGTGAQEVSDRSTGGHEDTA